MAKRRFRNLPENKSVEELTPEERREQRRRDRAQGGAAAKRPKGLGSPVRRAAIVGIPSAVIIAVVVVLLLNPFHAGPPCLAFTDIPRTSGDPGFPDRTNPNFGSSWCPQGVNPIMVVQAYLTITINGQSVPLPKAIGQSSNYSGGVTCTLPLATHTTDSPSGSLIDIASPWAYNYNLSAFFRVWSQSYTGVFVNATSANQPIIYQTGNLLGFTADARHQISLLVDGQLSSDGPSLNINNLPYIDPTIPSCIGTIHGTGHRIQLTYSTTSAVAAGPGYPGPTPGSGLPVSASTNALVDGPTPPPSLGVGPHAFSDATRIGSLPWLIVRPAPLWS